MSFAIKVKGQQTYVAREQFGPPGSLALVTETDNVYYHPMQFPTEEMAKAFLEGSLRTTHQGRRRQWEIVTYL